MSEILLVASHVFYPVPTSNKELIVSKIVNDFINMRNHISVDKVLFNKSIII